MRAVCSSFRALITSRLSQWNNKSTRCLCSDRRRRTCYMNYTAKWCVLSMDIWCWSLIELNWRSRDLSWRPQYSCKIRRQGHRAPSLRARTIIRLIYGKCTSNRVIGINGHECECAAINYYNFGKKNSEIFALHNHFIDTKIQFYEKFEQ
jgi:hypothetical protein